jgi:hypothetical protein
MECLTEKKRQQIAGIFMDEREKLLAVSR